MPNMKAKMHLTLIEKHQGDTSETLHFSAVGKSDAYPENGMDEDNTFAAFTPSADVTMLITNPELVGKFKQGDTYYVDFCPTGEAIKVGSAFEFELDQPVKISISGEQGSIIGRAEYKDDENQYWLEYQAADGRAVKEWWRESSLEVA